MTRDLPAITRLFDRVLGVVLRPVAGGRPLYRMGDPADALYMVQAGGFAVFRSVAGEPSFVGIIRPGEIVGESALLAGTPRSATVVALRDSEVAVMLAADFFREARRTPDTMIEIVRLVVARARTAGVESARPRLFALASLTGKVSARHLASLLACEMRGVGHKVALLTAVAAAEPPGWWSAVEREHDYVLCAAEADEDAWAAVCRRQVDRMMLIGHGAEPPPADCGLCATEPLQANGLVDLLLVHDGERPGGTTAWLDAVAPNRYHHLIGPDAYARLARVVTGSAVGLVLSGGGARAFAHVGAIGVLRDAGVPIDIVCGTSMGAIIAGGLASGWDAAEMDRRMRAAFVTSSPLDDIAWPFVAMTHGRKVEARLRKHFGEVDIADLPLPFFCMSADLGTGDAVAHRRGSLATALRASIALPGVMPPVTLGDQVLVDGGVLRNLPSELLRRNHDGTIVAVDVSSATGLSPVDVERPSPLPRWFWSGAWRRGPPIVSILMRSATLATGPDLAASRAAADLYVMPEVGGIEIRNWRAYDRAVIAGRDAMRTALSQLDTPVALLRQQRMADAAASPM